LKAAIIDRFLKTDSLRIYKILPENVWTMLSGIDAKASARRKPLC
jgi:hypothetical protein